MPPFQRTSGECHPRSGATFVPGASAPPAATEGPTAARSCCQRGLTQSPPALRPPASSRGWHPAPARTAEPSAPGAAPTPAAQRRPTGRQFRARALPPPAPAHGCAGLPATGQGVRSAARRFESWALGVGFSLLLFAFFFFFSGKFSLPAEAGTTRKLPQGAALPSQLTGFCLPLFFRSFKKQADRSGWGLFLITAISTANCIHCQQNESQARK